MDIGGYTKSTVSMGTHHMRSRQIHRYSFALRHRTAVCPDRCRPRMPIDFPAIQVTTVSVRLKS